MKYGTDEFKEAKNIVARLNKLRIEPVIALTKVDMVDPSLVARSDQVFISAEVEAIIKKVHKCRSRAP